MSNLETMIQWFADSEEYGKFDRVENPISTRPDLHAFMTLDKMDPGSTDAVSCAAHDEIWLQFEPEKIAAVITQEQVVELIRCGVMWDDENECFHMFA